MASTLVLRDETLYHTTGGYGALSEVMSEVPFLCAKDNAWLGIGYYFWLNSIRLAHFWGRVGYRSHYRIFSTSYIGGEGSVFNLYDNPEHRQDLQEAYLIFTEAVRTRIGFEGPVIVSEVIQYLKDCYQAEGIAFPYIAIVCPSVKRVDLHYADLTIPFLKYRDDDLLNLSDNDSSQRVQVCILSKNAVERPLRLEYSTSDGEC